MGKNSDGLRQRTNKSEKQENNIVSEKNELEQETWWQVLIQVTNNIVKLFDIFTLVLKRDENMSLGKML